MKKEEKNLWSRGHQWTQNCAQVFLVYRCNKWAIAASFMGSELESSLVGCPARSIFQQLSKFSKNQVKIGKSQED